VTVDCPHRRDRAQNEDAVLAGVVAVRSNSTSTAAESKKRYNVYADTEYPCPTYHMHTAWYC
jgi:hypothetical protein